MANDIYLTELPGDLKFVNSDEVPNLADFRGKALLLNFFTGASVACEQQVQDIKQLEVKYQDGLVVLGIHTPKHAADADDEQVLKIANRWHLRHLVANDREWQLWRQLGIEVWPTAVLFDYDGKLVSVYQGEARRAEIEARIQEILNKAQESDCRSYEPGPASRRPEDRGILRFPTRLIASENYLYIADTGYNRVLEVTWDGRVKRQFGSQNPGYWDARESEAGFRCPVGLALTRDWLYIADTGNHMLRRARLLTGDVETLAGVGHWERPTSADYAQAKAAPMASPMDVVAHNERVYIAQAGIHQIWQYDPLRNVLISFSGSGREDVLDGNGLFAAHAQPSGLAMGPEALYVLDASSSALRSVRLYDAKVSTLVPGGLFSSGSTDGPAHSARMCHPTALHFDSARGVLWVADTLNNKLRVYSIAKGEMKSLNINYALRSPSGVCVAQGFVYIANTDAHEVLRLDLKTGKLGRLVLTFP